ncbi:hypothetical protein AAKU55_003891 [Oxalobacteraceae bacterium GrIS 1.11]
MQKMTVLRPVGTGRVSVRPVQDMIVEVLTWHPEGMMLVPLHAEVDAELVRQRIWLAGCSYEQVRYCLTILRKENVILKTVVPRRAGHFKYSCKRGAAMCRERRKLTPAKPDKPLSVMEFCLHTLLQSPTTWDYALEYPESQAPAIGADMTE